MKKILIIVAVILAVVGAIFLYSARELIWYKYMSGKIMGEYETLVGEYKNDTYGGATPEETLSLFVSALKSGDAKLASNYFVPEKRKEYRGYVNNWINSTNIDNIVSELSTATGNNKLNDDIYQMSTVDENNTVSVIINFQKNEYTGKWLIRDL